MTGDEEGEEEGGLTQRTEGEEGEDEGGLENKRKKRSGQQNSPASASKLPSPTKEAKRHRSTDDSLEKRSSADAVLQYGNQNGSTKVHRKIRWSELRSPEFRG